MLRFFKQFLCRANLNNLPKIHHGDSVCDMLDDADIMADKQVGQVQLLLEVEEQVDNLGLD